MPHIVLSEEQAEVVACAVEPVEVRDSRGKVVATIDRSHSPWDVAEAKRRLASDQPRFTSAQVREHMNRLAEAVEENALTADEAREFFRRLQDAH
jgi:hypothetical protein